MGDVEQTSRVYRAFISYSHADAQWGDWLHKALETYRVPKGIIGRQVEQGAAPERLTPVFRDRFDLPAGANLGDNIQEALTHSLFQIVICSPRAAKSHWVNEEIKLFKKLHGNDRTLAVIIDGEPFASETPGREDEECFPPALRVLAGEDGELTDERTEPLAADARKDKDGKDLALAKLVAGLIGVNLDDLVQRDAQRRAQNARRVAGLSGVIAASMGLLAVLAIQSANEANKARADAENEIEFMLSDLRDKLEAVGRIEVLDSVGQRALNYYDRQNPRKLDDDALGRRSRAFHMVGEMDKRANKLDSAMDAYRKAADTTQELLRRSPNNENRIFEHAQSAFYVGDIAFARNDLKIAEESWKEYLNLAQRLIELSPENPEWRLEVAYATNNLGSLSYKRQNFDEALEYTDQSIAERQRLATANPNSKKYLFPLAQAFSSKAHAELALGRFSSAIDTLNQEIKVLDSILKADEESYRAVHYSAIALRRIGFAYLCIGKLNFAEEFLDKSIESAQRVISIEPNNAIAKLNASHALRARSVALEAIGKIDSARQDASHAKDFSIQVFQIDPSDTGALSTLVSALARQIDLNPMDKTLSENLDALMPRFQVSDSAGMVQALTSATIVTARQIELAGDINAANKLRNEVIERVSNTDVQLGPSIKLRLLALNRDAGNISKAQHLLMELKELGMNHPQLADF